MRVHSLPRTHRRHIYLTIYLPMIILHALFWMYRLEKTTRLFAPMMSSLGLPLQGKGEGSIITDLSDPNNL